LRENPLQRKPRFQISGSLRTGSLRSDVACAIEGDAPSTDVTLSGFFSAECHYVSAAEAPSRSAAVVDATKAAINPTMLLSYWNMHGFGAPPPV
jgi:hypothetical protein